MRAAAPKMPTTSNAPITLVMFIANARCCEAASAESFRSVSHDRGISFRMNIVALEASVLFLKPRMAR